MEQAGDGVGRDGDAELDQLLGDGGRGAARPAQSGDGIAGRIVLQQTVQDGDYVRRFFSVAVRPPPARRVLPLTTF